MRTHFELNRREMNKNNRYAKEKEMTYDGTHSVVRWRITRLNDWRDGRGDKWSSGRLRTSYIGQIINDAGITTSYKRLRNPANNRETWAITFDVNKFFINQSPDWKNKLYTVPTGILFKTVSVEDETDLMTTLQYYLMDTFLLFLMKTFLPDTIIDYLTDLPRIDKVFKTFLSSQRACSEISCHL